MFNYHPEDGEIICMVMFVCGMKIIIVVVIWKREIPYKNRGDAAKIFPGKKKYYSLEGYYLSYTISRYYRK